jgi:hypothetical protein
MNNFCTIAKVTAITVITNTIFALFADFNWQKRDFITKT